MKLRALVEVIGTEMTRFTLASSLLCLSLAALSCAPAPEPSTTAELGPAVEWRPGEFGPGAPEGVTISGDPTVVDSPFGKAMRFDGEDDALFFDHNPIAGLPKFTVEVVFLPDSDGLREQRFLHFGYPHAGRALLETRLTEDKQWYLDTYVESSEASKTLIDPDLLHPADRWHHVAYVVDDGQLRNYVNGDLELSAQIAYEPIQGGKTSLGVRLSQEYWFKGTIYSVRISPKALTPAAFTNLNLPKQ